MVEQLRLALDALGIDWVLWLLLGLSVVSLAIAGERWWYFRVNRASLDDLRAALDKALGGAHEPLNALRGLEAEVLGKPLNTWNMAPMRLKKLSLLRFLRREPNSINGWDSSGRWEIMRPLSVCLERFSGLSVRSTP